MTDTLNTKLYPKKQICFNSQLSISVIINHDVAMYLRAIVPTGTVSACISEA